MSGKRQARHRFRAGISPCEKLLFHDAVLLINIVTGQIVFSHVIFLIWCSLNDALVICKILGNMAQQIENTGLLFRFS